MSSSDKSKIVKGGEFFRMNGKKHFNLTKQCRAINAPRGSLICWDNRIPHATCQKLTSKDTKEVVYTGFLPDVKLNRKYIKKQQENLQKNIPPPGYITNNKKKVIVIEKTTI